MEVVAKTLQASIGVHDILTQWDDTRFRILVHSAGREQLAQLAEKLAAMVRISNANGGEIRWRLRRPWQP